MTGINGKLGVAGSISGTVRDGSGKLQAGVCVAAVPVDPSNAFAEAVTGPHGAYQLRQLGAGTYHVYLGDAFCGSSRNGQVFSPQWYKNQQSEATATDVTVTAGATATDINARLAARLHDLRISDAPEPARRRRMRDRGPRSPDA